MTRDRDLLGALLLGALALAGLVLDAVARHP